MYVLNEIITSYYFMIIQITIDLMKLMLTKFSKVPNINEELSK